MEPTQNTAKEKVSIQLDMASVPELSAQVSRPPVSKKQSRFNLLSLVKQAGVLVVVLLLSFASYAAISHYVVQSVEVVGVSMAPTLQEKSHYLLDRWTLRNREPQRNDVVVIRDPGDHGFSVKRVVAVAGESIYFKNGNVYVNGKELHEPYLKPGTRTYTYSKAWAEFITCGKGQYFVLGDNRPISIDSRTYGPVSREDVLGLVMVN